MSAKKTPRHLILQYADNVSTEKSIHPSKRRRPLSKSPDTHSVSLTNASRRSEHEEPRSKRRRSTGDSELTPRHLIQGLINTQDTSKPSTRRTRKETELPPPSSTRVRKSRRRSSIGVPSIDKIADQFTPRSLITGVLEQGVEETPAHRLHTKGDKSSSLSTIGDLPTNEISFYPVEASSFREGNVQGEGHRTRGERQRARIQIVRRRSNKPPEQEVDSDEGDESAEAEDLEDDDKSSRRDKHRSLSGVLGTSNRDDSSTSSPRRSARLPQKQHSNTPLKTTNVPVSQEIADVASEDDLLEAPLSPSVKEKSINRNVSSSVYGKSLHSNRLYAGEDLADRSYAGEDLADVSIASNKTSGLAGNETLRKLSQAKSTHSAMVDTSDLTLSSRKKSLSRSKTEVTNYTPQKTRPSIQKSPSSASKTNLPLPVDSRSYIENDLQPSPRRLSRSINRSTTGRALREDQSVDQSTGKLGQTSSRHLDEDSAVSIDVYQSPRQSSRSLNHSRNASSNKREQETGSHLHSRGDNSDSDDSGPGSSSNLSLSISKTKLAKQDNSKNSFSSRTEQKMMSESSSRQSKRASALRDELSWNENQSPKSVSPSQSQDVYSFHEDSKETSLEKDYKSQAGKDAVSEDDEKVDSADDDDDDDDDEHVVEDPEESIIPKVGGEARIYYSPLRTPHIKSKPPSMNKSKITSTPKPPSLVRPADKKNAKKKVATKRKPRKDTGYMPSSVVKGIFTHFCPGRVSKDAITEVEKVSAQFWENMAKDLESYSIHAHRKMIKESDVELLMKRQKFIGAKDSLLTLVEKYLPLELRQELIPVCRSGNKIELK